MTLKKTSLVIAAALLGAVQLLTTVEAQQTNSVAGNTVSEPKPRPKPRTAAQIEVDNFFQKLTKPVSFPEVPEATNAKFRFGLQKTDSTGMTSIGLRYGTSSTPAQVIEYFKQGLLVNKWEMKTASASGVRANKNGRSVFVNIVPPSTPDVTTDFYLNYYYRDR